MMDDRLHRNPIDFLRQLNDSNEVCYEVAKRAAETVLLDIKHVKFEVVAAKP